MVSSRARDDDWLGLFAKSSKGCTCMAPSCFFSVGLFVEVAVYLLETSGWMLLIPPCYLRLLFMF